MKLGFELALGALCALIVIGVFLRLIGSVLVALGKWLEQKSYEKMIPEERVVQKCRQMSEALRKHNR